MNRVSVPSLFMGSRCLARGFGRRRGRQCLAVALLVATGTASWGQVVTVNFAATPGPDGIPGTADDAPFVSSDFNAGGRLIDDEYAAAGLLVSGAAAVPTLALAGVGSGTLDPDLIFGPGSNALLKGANAGTLTPVRLMFDRDQTSISVDLYAYVNVSGTSVPIAVRHNGSVVTSFTLNSSNGQPYTGTGTQLAGRWIIQPGQAFNEVELGLSGPSSGGIGIDNVKYDLSPPPSSCFDASEAQVVVAGDGSPEEQFGSCVAISGNTMVVGARDETNAGGPQAGAAYVYVRSGGTWSQQAKLLASDRDDFHNFGSSVAILGDTIVVGAPHAGTTEEGSAYVYTRSGTTWSELIKLAPTDLDTFAYFGYSAALTSASGRQVLLVGAPEEGTTGSVYVFTLNTLVPGSVWTQQSKIEGIATSSWFGYSASVSGSTAVFGAPYANSGRGYARVFTANLTGTTWTQQADLSASDGANFDNFGWSVSISGNTIAAGAIGDDSHRGSAYVFSRSGTTWSQEQKIQHVSPAADDDFGHGVAVVGDMLIAGAPGDDNAGGGRAGSALCYTRSAGAWSYRTTLLASNAGVAHDMGYAAAISGSTVVVGAPGQQFASGTYPGSAIAFNVSYLDPGVQPLGVSISPCDSPVFTASAAGTAPVSYQWQFRGGPANTWTNLLNGPNMIGGQFLVNAAGAGTTSLTLDRNPQRWMFPGEVRCVVTNPCGGHVSLDAAIGVCYVNCDCSQVSPVQTANDFQCFLNSFASGAEYANCDGSTGTPALTPNDFQCFLNLYAQGCP